MTTNIGAQRGTLRGVVTPGGVFHAPTGATYPLTVNPKHAASNRALPNGARACFELEDADGAINVRTV